MHSTEQLATALAGRYRIERALGAGGHVRLLVVHAWGSALRARVQREK